MTIASRLEVLQSLHMSPDEETEDVVEKPKRAPRKRVPKVVSPDSTESPVLVKRAPRKRVPRKVVEESVIAAPVVVDRSRAPRRKAPTPIATERATKKRSRKQMVVVTAMIIFGVGASAAVGFMDAGGIDVNQTIEKRNDKIRNGQLQDVIIPVQNNNPLPDGGLIHLSPEELAKQAQNTPPPAPVATSSASSTETTASSTPEGNVPLPENEL